MKRLLLFTMSLMLLPLTGFANLGDASQSASEWEAAEVVAREIQLGMSSQELQAISDAVRREEQQRRGEEGVASQQDEEARKLGGG